MSNKDRGKWKNFSLAMQDWIFINKRNNSQKERVHKLKRIRCIVQNIHFFLQSLYNKKHQVLVSPFYNDWFEVETSCIDIATLWQNAWSALLHLTRKSCRSCKNEFEFEIVYFDERIACEPRKRVKENNVAKGISSTQYCQNFNLLKHLLEFHSKTKLMF